MLRLCERGDAHLAGDGPLACDEYTMGVSIVHGNAIRACATCARTGRGHRDDHDAEKLVLESLAALAEVRESLWFVNNPDAEWSSAAAAIS